MTAIATLAAMMGCRSILGITDTPPPIDCLTDTDCGSNEFCSSAFKCASRAGADAATDAPLTDAKEMNESSAPDQAPDATLGSDANRLADANGTTLGTADTTIASDADAAAGRSDSTAAPEPNETDSRSETATEATHDDAENPSDATLGGPDDAPSDNTVLPADAADANTETLDDGGNGTCGITLTGACVQCPGSCTLQRPGWRAPPLAGAEAFLSGNTFVAVQIAIPNPSYLLRLGIDATNTGTALQLALYTDSGGKPGSLIAATNVTIEDDPLTEGSEGSVPCADVCEPIGAGTYWVGAVVSETTDAASHAIFMRSDGASNTTLYQGTVGSYIPGQSLGDGTIPSGTLSSGNFDRNLYVVVTQP